MKIKDSIWAIKARSSDRVRYDLVFPNDDKLIAFLCEEILILINKVNDLEEEVSKIKYPRLENPLNI